MKPTYYSAYCAPWGDFLHPYGTPEIVGNPKQLKADHANFIVFWGGADISPAIYHHMTNGTQGVNIHRDYTEEALMDRAIELGIPILGICRGAQLLCAKAGGFLVQHIDNHAGERHKVITPDNKEFTVNSHHHQMMAGWQELPAHLLAWSLTNRSKVYLHDKAGYKAEDHVEPEAIFFDGYGLGVQWHPEWMEETSEATQFVYENINNYLLKVEHA